jgi:hypothetical protein
MRQKWYVNFLELRLHSPLGMSKSSGKRRADEDAAKEAGSLLNIPQLNEQQQEVVDAQTKCMCISIYCVHTAYSSFSA